MTTEEAADRDRLMLFVASRLRMGTPPQDIEVAARGLDAIELRHAGRQYRLVLARTREGGRRDGRRQA